MPRTKQAIPANENASQRFVRLANHRVNNLIKGIKALGTLGGNGYLSTPEQRKKIQVTLTECLNRAMSSMERGETVQDFKL